MSRGRSRQAFVALFLLPATALYALFVVWPVLQAFAFSLYRWRGVSEQRSFVGLDNFRRLAADPVVRQALVHNLELFLGAGLAILVLSLAVAHALHEGSVSARALRAVYLFPQVISLVAVAVLWMFMYNPQFGMVRGALQAAGAMQAHVGLHALPASRWAGTAWLGEPTTALAAVGVAFVWHALGFYIMLFSAGLRAIPVEVGEAAVLDGAQGLLRLRLVTLPMLWSILRIAVVYLAINSLNVFALVFLMTVGGPDRSSEVMLTYLYEQAFRNSDFGFATALAVANFVLVMLLSGAVLLAFRRDPQEGAA